MSLWLSRLEPPLRPTAQRVQFELDVDSPIAGQAKQIVQAVARGEVDPDTGKQLLDMLSALVGLRDIEHFLAELRKLRGSQSPIAGGVMTT